MQDNQKKPNEEPNENEVLIYPLVDEDGNESEFEKIGEAQLNGKTYFAFIPVEDAEKVEEAKTSEETFCEYVILRLDQDESGEDMLVSIDDDEEFDNVADIFDDMFSEEIDYDGGKE